MSFSEMRPIARYAGARAVGSPERKNIYSRAGCKNITSWKQGG